MLFKISWSVSRPKPLSRGLGWTAVEFEDATLMLAGPVKIHPRVLRVLTTASIGHRTAGFRAVNEEIRDLLRYVFQTTGPIAVLSGSGTAGLESMVSGLLGPEDRVLCLTNGKFGERMYEIAGRYSQADQRDLPWGQPVDLEGVRAQLEKTPYTALAVCHNETSTGSTNPLEGLAAIARAHKLLFLVDGITSVGGLPVDLEGWGIDGIVLGSQKCVAAPAGLSAVALSRRGYEALREDGPYALNLKAHVDRLEQGDTPFTPAIHLFLAFREALRMVKDEGLGNRLERTARLASSCRAAGQALGLELFPDRQVASNTVTAFRYPEGVTDGDFRTRLRDAHQVLVAGGQGPLKGQIFRIGHMGICSRSDLIATFGAIEEVLASLGHSVSPGAGVGALLETH